MAQRQEREAVEEIGKRTGRDPTVMLAAASVVLAWYQYYVRGNKEHGLFIGLWPPTILAFSNTMRLSKIASQVESKTASLVDWLTANR